MSVHISPEFQEFVREKVASGKYRSEQEVVEDGLRYLRENDILSGYSREELNALIEEGERAFDEGDFVEFDKAEFERIIAEGRQMLAERTRWPQRHQQTTLAPHNA